MTPGNNIYLHLFITFIAFTSFTSSKFESLFFTYKLSYYATGGPYYAWVTCGETEYKKKFRHLVKRSLYQRQNIIICVPMVVARFSKNKITFVLLNRVFFVIIRGPFYTNLKIRNSVFLNNETDLALTIHSHLPNTKYQIVNKGFLLTIWFVYDLNYGQNSILHRLRGA